MISLMFLIFSRGLRVKSFVCYFTTISGLGPFKYGGLSRHDKLMEMQRSGDLIIWFPLLLGLIKIVIR